MRAMIQRFMYGRYGSDQLNWFLLILYLILYLLAMITQSGLLSLLSTVAVVITVFRLLSRNIPRRREENVKFLRVTAPAVRWYKLHATMAKDKDHRYFKCPHCSQLLRVPKGKGKISITCCNCSSSFEKKT